MSGKNNSGSKPKRPLLPTPEIQSDNSQGGGKWVVRNLRYKILAVLLAIVLWFYAANERGLMRERVFDNVPIAVHGLSEGLVLAGELPQAQITLRGSVEGLNVNELTAYLDLSGISVGQATVPVMVNVPSGISFVGVKPSRIGVQIDVRAEKQIPVEIKLTGQTAAGYVSMAPTVRPSQVVVSGARSVLANLQQAYVSLALNNTDRSLSETIPISIIDQQGLLVKGLQLTPASVEVFVPVIKEEPEKTVPVRPVVTGAPASGYQVVGVTVEPETVKIVGPAESLEKVTEVTTRPVDITGVDKTAVYPSQLELRGINGVEPAQVSVIVRVAQTTLERDFGPLAVQLENADNGFTASVQPKEISVRITGPTDRVEKLTPQDISARVNLAGLIAGKHQVPVAVSLPPGLTISQITPEILEVSLTPIENAGEE